MSSCSREYVQLTSVLVPLYFALQVLRLSLRAATSLTSLIEVCRLHQNNRKVMGSLNGLFDMFLVSFGAEVWL